LLEGKYLNSVISPVFHKSGNLKCQTVAFYYLVTIVVLFCVVNVILWTI